MYCAVIGDIIESKKTDNRNVVQNQLKEVLNKINLEYSENIASKFTITLGDEFQGLLAGCKNIFTILDLLSLKMYPVRIRFGIGVGDVSTDINPDICLGADGAAFWNARAAIEYIHDNNDYGKSRTHLIFDGKPYLLEVVNSTIRLCDLIEAAWTNRQRRFILDSYSYFIKEKFTQKEISQKLNLSAQTVNSEMKNTKIMTYLNARNNIENLLINEKKEN